VAEATLRLKFGMDPATVREHLTRAFVKLFDLYGQTRFEVVVTANAILEGPAPGRESADTRGRRASTYSLYYGQDFSADGERREASSELSYVSYLSDVEKLKADYAAVDFTSAFNKTFSSTAVHVHSLASLVYIVRKPLGDFSRDKKTQGRQQQQLF
jgi:hypothetical protein